MLVDLVERIEMVECIQTRKEGEGRGKSSQGKDISDFIGANGSFNFF